jgi:hypothetical protein
VFLGWVNSMWHYWVIPTERPRTFRSELPQTTFWSGVLGHQTARSSSVVWTKNSIRLGFFSTCRAECFFDWKATAPFSKNYCE